MTEFNIRTMTVDDLPAFKPLLEQLGYDLDAAEVACRFDAVVAAPGHVLEVAADGERLVGFIHYFARAALEKPPEVIVQALVVDAGVRGGGIGQRLMRRAEDWAVDNGYSSVALGTQTSRDDAHAFYERLGYRVAATSHLMRKAIGGRGG